jgi:hypothetical protein
MLTMLFFLSRYRRNVDYIQIRHALAAPPGAIQVAFFHQALNAVLHSAPAPANGSSYCKVCNPNLILVGPGPEHCQDRPVNHRERQRSYFFEIRLFHDGSSP